MSGIYEFFENLVVMNWLNYVLKVYIMYVYVLDKKKKDLEKIRNCDRSSEMDVGFGVYMYFNIEEVFKVVMRCLYV